MSTKRKLETMPNRDGLILKKLGSAGTITLNDHSYEMIFNINASCLLEDYYAERNQRLPDVMAMSNDKRPLNFYRAAFWAMAKAGGAPFDTVEDLGAMITLQNMSEVVQLVAAAIAKGTVESKEGNPTVAAAANQ
jgi:hypothetical protein